MDINYKDYILSINNIKDINDIKKSTFKHNNHYNIILEHVTYNNGLEYLNEIKTKFKSFYDEFKNKLIELCNNNDKYGSPRIGHFDDFTTCSPSNLRYILHSLLIIKYIKECNLNNINFIEIGAGYGGLCYYIYNIAELYNIKINSYSIFDLPQVNNLIKLYLNVLLPNININLCDITNFKNLKDNSFLISNYAFSEITEIKRKEYTDLVLNKYVSHGFLTWNFIKVYDFIENKNIIVEPEIPSVPYSENFYIKIKPFE